MSGNLVLLRHGQCEWESQQRFVGWADTALTERGAQQAQRAGQLLRAGGSRIDAVHTSVLRRARRTASLAVAQLEREPSTITHSWRLNARHYGALEGRRKQAVNARYGPDRVYAWRRQVGSPPPALSADDERHPRHDPRYRDIDDTALPATECFGSVRDRVLAYWRDTLQPLLRTGHNLLVVAHGSSLRPLIQWLSRIDEAHIVSLDVPTAEPLVYAFAERDDTLHAQSWRYLSTRPTIAPLAQPSVHRALRARGVRYVTLSGVCEAPQVPTDARAALLVDQTDVEATREVLADVFKDQRSRAEDRIYGHIYGTLGQAGTDYRKLPYLPPHLAEEVLEKRRLLADGVAVPSVRHRILLTAFDRLYHGNDAPARVLNASTGHDHEKEPASLAGDDLDAYLAARGWRPPLDLLGRMSWCNEWIQGYLRDPSGADDADPGLAVFVLREVGLARGGHQRLHELLDRAGFEMITSKILSDEERARARLRLRVGRWGRGPWSMSGGGPAAATVAYDLEPLPPSRGERERFPWLSNGRVLVKERIRADYNAGLPAAQHCNVLHATDNSPEARELIDILMPEERDTISARIAAMKHAYATTEIVTRRLTRFARRAKVEVVLSDGKEVVKKTFKPSKLRYCRRERQAGEALRHILQVPALLAATDNAVVFEYFPDAWRYDRRSGALMPLAVARDAISGLRAIYNAGYALLDARPENMLITPTGVKLIDFEFLHRYTERPTRFEDSYDMAGCPDSYTGDRPKGGPTFYARDWQPFIGLSLHSLLHDPIWVQFCKRLWVRIWRLAMRLLRSLGLAGIEP